MGGLDLTGTGRRAVSFICYLNEAGWTHADGGALRVFGKAAAEAVAGGVYDDGDEPYVDVLPEEGSLVLFDSMSVFHEVLTTRRERACLVGWFLNADDGT